jgi:hypothetical protein
MAATLTPARHTPATAARTLARAEQHAVEYRALAAAATDPEQADALLRIAESHDRIAARARAAAARFAA